jgi:UDPglucose 6-dehydrogenase
MEWAGRVMPDMQLAEDAYELVTDCDAIIVCTEWNEFMQLDLRRVKSLMKQPVIVDGRNIYEPTMLREMGFTYLGVGRGYLSVED